jgi:hypothetical protein
LKGSSEFSLLPSAKTGSILFLVFSFSPLSSSFSPKGFNQHTFLNSSISDIHFFTKKSHTASEVSFCSFQNLSKKSDNQLHISINPFFTRLASSSQFLFSIKKYLQK